MTEFQSNGKHYLVVTVPEGSKNYSNELQSGQIDYDIDIEVPLGRGMGRVESSFNDYVMLPVLNGQYTIIGLASEMSEEQAQSIGINGKWILNQNIEASTSKVAVIMFIRSLNLNPETTLIIEKL